MLRSCFSMALLALIFSQMSQAADRPNILFIAVDDLNDWVGCLGGHEQSKTPNIDQLASRGVLFANAHCQAPICNPSRTSFMLGLRPSTTGIYQNAPWFRDVMELRDHVTLGEYFGRHGYQTLTAGKIFHSSREDKKSFQTWGPRPGQRLKQDERIVPELTGLWDYGAQQYPENEFGDHITADWAIEQLNAIQTDESPFLLAIGFYRPHVPMYAPQRFFDARPRDGVQLPPVKDDDRDDLPQAAIDLISNDVPPPHSWFVENDEWTDVVRAYQSCVSFTDEQIGRLLAALAASPHADNTIVVMFSDHGFHLGEKQSWAKRTLWERSTHVPLIIATPEGLQGARCERAVELLSLYPTLCELCDVPAPSHIEGTSLTPLLADPQAAWDRPAVTTFGQNNHSVRDDRYRYIRYADGSEELYDMSTDPHEWTNLASDAPYAKTIARLAKWLPTVNVAPAKPSK